MNILEARTVHCIGIGGIGISAVAKYLLTKGARVTGSDVSRSTITDALVSQGAKIYIGPHRADHITIDVQAVIFSPAVSEENVEYRAALSMGAKLLDYPHALAELLSDHDAIVISGTHGKSTTTAMMGTVLSAAGEDPSVVVGSLVPSFNGNVRVGEGKYFVVEGDEYKRSFLAYTPSVLILTNIESDHLDYYRDLDDVKTAFASLVDRVPEYGLIVANGGDHHVRDVCEKARARVVWFGDEGPYAKLPFDLVLPGRHNVLNALAVYAAGTEIGLPQSSIQESLAGFRGIWRRFEIKGVVNGITVIDDYAHHPTEVRATLQAAREAYPSSRIWCIFQPHQRSRTRLLFDDFVRAFSVADKVVLTEIYTVAGRDSEHDMTGKVLADAVAQRQDSTYIHDFRDVPRVLSTLLRSGDVVITMGAGTITEISDQVLKSIAQK